MFTVSEIVHPFASVIRQVYVPAHKLLTTAVVANVGSSHWYVLPPEPPLAITLAEPLQFPKQSTLIVVDVSANGVGSVIIVVAVVTHPFASVTVTV